MELREELEARYAASLRAELSLSGTRPLPEDFLPPRLPAALRESIVAAAELGDPSPLADFYCERMPRMLVEQILRGEDPARRLLWMEIDPSRTVRLREALHGIRHAFAHDGLTFAHGDDLLEHPTCVARLAAATQLGSGLPLVGAYPAEREVIAADLRAGGEPHEVLDLRLSGNLVHEICHGPPRPCQGPPAPWLVVEAAALHLGATAFPRHVFPEMPGEAIPGVSSFVLLGESLARLFGRAALWRVASGASLEEMFGPTAGRILAAAGWQEWLRRREPPFARDASDGVAWVKLADATRGPSPLLPVLERAASLDPLAAAREPLDLLRAADAVPWEELPWWREEPTEADASMARSAIAAMFHVDVLEGTFQTHPHRPARFRLDLAACLLTRERDPRGVGPGEPPCWIVPPPLCRRLLTGKVRPLRMEGSDCGELLAFLLEESASWTSSRS